MPKKKCHCGRAIFSSVRPTQVKTDKHKETQLPSAGVPKILLVFFMSIGFFIEISQGKLFVSSA